MNNGFKSPLLLMAFIFIESSIPSGDGSGGVNFLNRLDPGLQNFLHVPLYGLLSFLWMNGFVKKGMKTVAAVSLAFLIAVLYGCFDEFYQVYVPGRYGGVTDICLDTTGAAAGVVVYLTVLRIQSKRWRGGHP